MKHILLTRMKFKNKELMKKYLVLTKEYLVPSLKSQTCQNFTWLLLVEQEDINFLKTELDFPFIPFLNNSEQIKYCLTNNIEIQTRHDCDDFMFPHYIETIQKTYLENKDKYSSFLIQSQPTQLIIKTGKINSLGLYHDKRTSMHLSLCQTDIKYNIHDRGHGQMWEIVDKVISLGEGYTQWIIHGNNISCKTSEYQRSIKKTNGN